MLFITFLIVSTIIILALFFLIFRKAEPEEYSQVFAELEKTFRELFEDIVKLNPAKLVKLINKIFDGEITVYFSIDPLTLKVSLREVFYNAPSFSLSFQTYNYKVFISKLIERLNERVQFFSRKQIYSLIAEPKVFLTPQEIEHFIGSLDLEEGILKKNKKMNGIIVIPYGRWGINGFFLVFSTSIRNKNITEKMAKIISSYFSHLKEIDILVKGGKYLKIGFDGTIWEVYPEDLGFSRGDNILNYVAEENRRTLETILKKIASQIDAPTYWKGYLNFWIRPTKDVEILAGRNILAFFEIELMVALEKSLGDLTQVIYIFLRSVEYEARAQKIFETKLEMFKNVLSGVDLGIAVVDEDYRIVYFNNQFLNLFNIKIPEGYELLSKNIVEVLKDLKPEVYNITKESFNSTSLAFSEEISKDFQITLEDKERWLNLRIKRLGGEGGYIRNFYYIISVEDISERKENEEKLKFITQTLKEGYTKAKDIIENLVPSLPIVRRGLKVDGLYLPSDIIGGDIYLIDELHENVFVIVLIDIAGHGLSSALYSTLAHGIIYETIATKSMANPSDISLLLPEEILKELHERFLNLKTEGNYLAVSYILLDLKNYIMYYLTAASPDIVMLRKGAKTGPELILLKTPTKPLGVYLGSQELKIEHKEIKLQKGDRIFTFSDGFIDVLRETNEGGGDMKGVYDIVLQTSNQDFETSIRIIKEYIRDVIKSLPKEIRDDITFIAFEIE